VALRVKGFTENETSREDVENGQKFGPDTRRMSSQSFLKYFFVWCCEPSLLEVFVILLVIQHDPHHISRFSRDMEFQCPLLGSLPLHARRLGAVVSHISRKTSEIPRISCTRPSTSLRVRLSLEERRMKSAEPTKLHRKSGVWGTRGLRQIEIQIDGVPDTPGTVMPGNSRVSLLRVSSAQALVIEKASTSALQTASLVTRRL
jgi:hypothetical protein